MMHSFRRKRIRRTLWRRIKQVFRVIRSIVLVFLFFVFLAFFIAAGWFYYHFSKVPKVKAETLLVMNFDGIILDAPSLSYASQRLLGEDVQTLRVVVNNIRKATEDPRIIGILMQFKNYGLGRASAQEIRDELLKFKQTGKKIFAYSEGAGWRTYSLMSIADKIYMPPSGATYLMGLHIEIPFMRELLDKIGITPEHMYIGKYKTGPQPELFERMSEAHREVLHHILDNLYSEYITQVAEARQVPPEKVKKWLDDGLYSASEAHEVGMIDELIFEDQLEKKLQIELGLIDETAAEEQSDEDADDNAENTDDEDEDEPELYKLNNSQYARVKFHVPNLHTKGEKIAVVYAQGVILSGKSAPIGAASPTIGSESMTELLNTLAKDKELKGIILRVDSGGGSGLASAIIHRAVQEARKKKPVVVSMAGAAASGAYEISAPADAIIAYPSTLTGSIGTYSSKYSFQGLHKMLGINFETVQRGKNSGMFTPTRTRTPEEYKQFQKFLWDHYNDFVRDVAEGRKMTFEEVDAIARGRVWMGEKALEIGLVDKLGGFETAIDVMKEKLDIPADEDVELVEYPKIERPLELLKQRFLRTHVTPHIPDELLDVQQRLHTLDMLRNEPYLAWFPYEIVVDDRW